MRVRYRDKRGTGPGAADQLRQQGATLSRQWQQQLERARYEVALVQTRYEQVDPTMRLVAIELEQQRCPPRISSLTACPQKNA
jgi:hypothetical protein